MDHARSPKLRRIEEGVERSIRDLAENGGLAGMSGEGQPLPEDDSGDDGTWAARHVMRQANAVPDWAELRKDIEARTERIRRRIAAHRQWLHDRTAFLALLPADRIVDTSHATTARDLKVRAELERSVAELNTLVRRYDLMVVPTMQLPLVTMERLEREAAAEPTS
jgi:hypothetical protein